MMPRAHSNRFFLLVLVAVISPHSSWADGKAFGGVFPRFSTLSEREQVAAIAYVDGIQRMVIAVNLAMEESHSALWILPIPADATQTVVDVIDTFPRFQGFDPRRPSHTIWSTFTLVRFTQVWPTLFEAVLMPNYLGGVARVYASTEKWGITSEVIRADSQAALSEYIKGKGVELDSAQLDSLDPYLKGDHTLVVTWISSWKEVLEKFPEQKRILSKGRWPSLYVEFPVEEPFYPLRPSFGESKESVDLMLAVVGHVQAKIVPTDPQDPPDWPEKIMDQPEYFLLSSWPKGSPERFMRGLPKDNIPYTFFFDIFSENELKFDVAFTDYKPWDLDLAMRWAIFQRSVWGSWILGGVILFIVLILSYVSAGLAGLTLKKKWKGSARLGLWNVFTVIGLIIALILSKKDNQESRSFVYRFSFIFVFLSFLLQFLFAFSINYMILGMEFPDWLFG